MLKYWLWLTTRKELTVREQLAVLRHFGTPEAAYCAQKEELAAVEGLRSTAPLENKSLQEPEEILNDCYRKQIAIMTYQDASYPGRLRAIDDPPLVLYYQGSAPAIDTEPVIAVVGTRRASAYGLMQAKQFGYQLGRMGAIVVSGGADGIDTMALKGALTAGRPVVAVLGCGVDVVYPACNRHLFEDVRTRGWLVSEYPPGTAALAHHFPIRNRIMSALSLGTLVIEAPERSGALITAQRALDQGRDVFAVPANVDSVTCAGNLSLLKQGALVATDGWDVLKEYVYLFPELARRQPMTIPMMLARGEQPHKSERPLKSPAAKEPDAEENDTKNVDKPENKAYIDVHEILDSLSADERAVIEQLVDGAKHIDDIVDACQLPAGRVLASMTLLEVKGYIRRLPARRFSLAEK